MEPSLVISYHIGGVVASYVHLEGGRLWALAPVGSNQTIKLVIFNEMMMISAFVLDQHAELHYIGGVVASYVHLEGGRLWALAPVGSNQTIKLVFVASPLSTHH
jgi:hypothetical protein